jgi:hypothetical protein
MGEGDGDARTVVEAGVLTNNDEGAGAESGDDLRGQGAGGAIQNVDDTGRVIPEKAESARVELLERGGSMCGCCDKQRRIGWGVGDETEALETAVVRLGPRIGPGDELAGEAGVRRGHRPDGADEAVGGLIGKVVCPHEIRDDECRRAGDALEAMDEDAPA